MMKIESKWWCPLTDNYDHYPEWQSCPETASTYGGNDPGKQCHFPFVYRKRLYSTCIRAGGSLHYENPNDPVPTDNGESGYWWCSTTPDFDFDGKWTKCRPQLAYQLPCYFSSMLNTVGGLVQNSQHECQPFAGHWICRTELNQIRECPKTVQNLHNIKTEGGNDPGFPCHFPFQATISLHRDEDQSANIPVRKQNYTRCLPGIGESGSSQQLSIYPTWIGYWCATTDNYDRDKLWTRCNVDLTQPEHLTFISSNKYIQKFTLSEIWSKLMWLSVLKESEKVKIVLPNQLYGNDFSQSLSHLEYLHASWELLEKRNDQHQLITKEYKTSQEINELNWWTWLAPFWWITYKLNETYSPDSVFHETVIHSKHVSTLNIGNNDNNRKNPLIYGLKLPLWLDDWSESAWDNYALHMKNRWINLIKHLYHKWLQSWLVAFSVGFISAIGIIIFILLIIILLVKKSIRIQMISSVLRSKYQSYDKSDFGEKYKINDTINNDDNDKNIINNVDSQTLCSVNVTNIDGLQKTLHLIPHCHGSFSTCNTDNMPGCIKQLTLSNTNDTFNSSNSFHQSVKNFKEFESTEHNPDRLLLLSSSSPSSSTSLSVCRPIKNSVQSRCCEYSWKMPIYDTTRTTNITATALTSNSNNNFKRNSILDTANNYYISSIIKEHIKCILDEISQSFSNEGKLNDVSKCMQNVSRIIDLYLNQHSKYFYNDEKEHIVNTQGYSLDSHQELAKCCLYTIDDVDHEYTCCCRDYSDHNGRRRLDPPPRPLYCHPHDYSTLSYCDNSPRHSITNYDNQAEVVEPSAPPPSYDQVVPIL
ncbi:unnamed protein product [Trichobilharzia szidati]|nr:unnamed protein product [Trichobilharzia szidati]